MHRALLVVAACLAFVPALATAAVAPSVCSGTCTVGSHVRGYSPVVLSLASGSSVVWTASDIAHIQVETPILSSETCIATVATPFDPSPPVRFDLANGALTATSGLETEQTDDDYTATCTNAAIVGATASLSYFCLLHPSMRGQLVVLA